jgi:hypothetical protein
MRRCHHADVGVAAGMAADRIERPVFQDAQQLHLEARAHLADLVEEDRSPVGELEAPGAGGNGAGEGPANVTEQLALQQLLRDRATVHRNEAAARAARQVVERARDQLLARAAVAGHEDGRTRGPDATQQVEDSPHARVVPDQSHEPRLGGRGLLVQAAVLGNHDRPLGVAGFRRKPRDRSRRRCSSFCARKKPWGRVARPSGKSVLIRALKPLMRRVRHIAAPVQK